MVNIDEYAKNLKHTLKGKDNTFFLINDYNSELKQHYDSSFETTMNKTDFRAVTEYKENYSKTNKIKYACFIIPDKSVVLRDYLPFDTSELYRNIDDLKEYLYDLYEILNLDDYLVNDTNISEKASIKLTSYVLSKLYGEDINFFENQLLEKCFFTKKDYKGNLFLDAVWSYDKDDVYKKYAHMMVDSINLKKDYITVASEEIPENFRSFENKKSVYLFNENSISDEKILILHDDYENILSLSFLAYYREVFLYNDSWNFNENLIDWFNPNVIIEIRNERFLETAKFKIIKKHKELIPIELTLEKCEIQGSKLNVELIGKSIDSKPINSTCELLLNDNLIDTFDFVKGSCSFEYELDDNQVGYINVLLSVRKNKVYNPNSITKTVFRPVNNVKTYFKTLNKTMMGKDAYCFLINDKNSEIRQHYDSDYVGFIDYEKLTESLTSKRNYLNNKSINYKFFVIPDKSVVLRDYLPFKTSLPIRHVDKLRQKTELHNIIYDLRQLAQVNDYLINDTHISYNFSLKLVPFVLSIVHGGNMNNYKNQILDKVHMEKIDHKGDLFYDRNWSYPKKDFYKKYAHILVDIIKLNEKAELVEEDLPQEFRRVSGRKTEYYINENSISDKKAILLHDSSADMFKEVIISYYREIIFYWDHWLFNKDLVNWFKPDDVLEIRTERFLDHPLYPIVSEDADIQIPLFASMDEVYVSDFKLHLLVKAENHFRVPVNLEFDIYCDEDKLGTYNIVNGIAEVEQDLNDISEDFNLKVDIKETSKTKGVILKKLVRISSDWKDGLKSLKGSLIGKNNTFFLVNDTANEVLQHFDQSYKCHMDFNEFDENYKIKTDFLESKNIKYACFIIPDKSVVLREFLPFDTSMYMRRNLDKISYDNFYDLFDLLSVDDYLVNDTNISKRSAIDIISFILSKIYDDNMEVYQDLLLRKVLVYKVDHKGNLFLNASWSYEMDQVYMKYAHMLVDTVEIKDAYIDVKLDDIPENFRYYNNRKSRYFINNNSISDEKVLVLHDGNQDIIAPPFIVFYREVFLYQDLWSFNKELVEWFNPDVVIDLRIERYLDISTFTMQ